MKRLFRLLFLLAASIFFFSCNRLHGGTIIEKAFKEAHTETIYIDSKVGEVWVSTPQTVTRPAQYKLRIEGDFEGHTIREWFYVRKSVFDTCDVGEQIKFH